MSSRPKPVQRSWRGYLRFSVRGLAVFVLLIGSWLGWIVRNAVFSARRWRESRKPGAGLAMTGSLKMEFLFREQCLGHRAGL